MSTSLSRVALSLGFLLAPSAGLAQSAGGAGSKAEPVPPAVAADSGSEAEAAPAAQAQTPPASASGADVTAVAAAPEPATTQDDPKLVALRGELTTLMDDLVAARARAAVLGKTLFKTRVVVRLQNLIGGDPVLAKVVLSLDGAPLFRGDAAALAGDAARRVFEGFASPGPHVLGVEVEQNARVNAAYGYTLRESYRFQAPREKETELTLILDDDSNLAEDFPDDGEGEYDVRTRLRVQTRALGSK